MDGAGVRSQTPDLNSSKSQRSPVTDGGILNSTSWPAVFDPRVPGDLNWSTPTSREIDTALREWNVSLDDSDLTEFRAMLDGQELREYQPWQQLFGFDTRTREAYLIVSGTYVRVFGWIAKDEQLIYFPSFQPITKGAILTPSALTNTGIKSFKSLEMCICVQEGSVIRVNNPAATLKCPSVLRALAISRDSDASWLRDSLFSSQRNEDRVKYLIESLAAWKELEMIDSDERVFRYPVSQSAVGDFLGLSDNTLRPYLCGKGFDWIGGRLVLSDYFVRMVISERPVGNAR